MLVATLTLARARTRVRAHVYTRIRLTATLTAVVQPRFNRLAGVPLGCAGLVFSKQAVMVPSLRPLPTPPHQAAEAVDDGFSRLIQPRQSRAVRRRLTEDATAVSVQIFIESVRALLMAEPVRGRRCALQCDSAVVRRTRLPPGHPCGVVAPSAP